MQVNKEASASEMRKANPGNFNPIINGRMLRPPVGRVWIHSVAKKDFTVSQRPLFPSVKLRGCTNGERFVTCTSFPDPITQVIVNESNGAQMTVDESCWRAVIDLLNPSNPTEDPYWNNPGSIAAYFSTSVGCDHISQGLFPSLNEIPTEEELRKAEKVRDDGYRSLTQEAFRLAAISTAQLNEFLQAHPEVHAAMDALGLQANWHSTYEVKMLCPNCGDSVKQNIAFHQSSAGVLCVLDPAKAFRAGAISRERFEELSSMDDSEDEPKRGPGRPRKVQ